MQALFRKWIIFGLKQFFVEIRIKGEPLTSKGPLLIVSNHPNSLLDPLIITYVYPQQLWYLAKSTAFKGPIIGKILRVLRMLPVYRRQDVGEETWRNEETFQAVIREISCSGSILIFPEGVSTGERRLSKVKTGAARIVLQAEALSDFNLGLVVQPVGLTYSSSGGFKSSVSVRVSKPIEVWNWRGAYEADPIAAVKDLTETIEREIRKVTVEVINSGDDGLVEEIAWLYRSAGRVVDEHEGYQLIAKNLELQGEKYTDLKQRILRELKELRQLAERMNLEREQIVLRPLSMLKTLILAPLILLGVLINYLPYKFLSILARIDSNKILTGVSRSFSLALILFPLWYLVLSVLVALIAAKTWVFLPMLLLFLGLGHLTNKYWQSFKLIMHKFFSFAGLSKYRSLIAQRDRLLQELDLLRLE
jgi:glycerol-3-phosphate O-acyltransferase / dihydroxyacetone phosphate acyltransferase